MSDRDPYNPEPLIYVPISQDDALTRSRTFLAQVKSRRTVRDFSTRPVPFELIENAVAAAATAPSGANQQPWTFCVIGDATLKAKMRAAAEAEERENSSGG